MGIAAWSIVGACLVVALLAWLVLQLRIIWPPLIFAVIIVYLFKPLVDRLERYKVPRVAGGCLSYLLFGGVLVLIGVLMVPVISSQSVELVDHVPEVIDSAAMVLSDVAVWLNLPAGFQDVETLSGGVSDWFADPANREVILEGIGRDRGDRPGSSGGVGHRAAGAGAGLLHPRGRSQPAAGRRTPHPEGRPGRDGPRSETDREGRWAVSSGANSWWR